jgi:hypothetical protein
LKLPCGSASLASIKEAAPSQGLPPECALVRALITEIAVDFTAGGDESTILRSQLQAQYSGRG